jgi:hypothetical protein
MAKRNAMVGKKILAFNAGQKKNDAGEPAYPDPEDFEDLGSWVWWQARLLFQETYDLLQAGLDAPHLGIGIDDTMTGDDLERLREELSTREYLINPLSGKIKVEKKDDYIKRMVAGKVFTSEHSPDFADAFLICLWAWMRVQTIEAQSLSRAYNGNNGSAGVTQQQRPTIMGGVREMNF